MKKYAVILPLGLLLWASCEQDSVSNGTNPENQVVEVKFNLTLRQDVADFRSTRGLPDGLPDDPVSKNDGEESDTDAGEEAQPTVTLSTGSAYEYYYNGSVYTGKMCNIERKKMKFYCFTPIFY